MSHNRKRGTHITDITVTRIDVGLLRRQRDTLLELEEQAQADLVTLEDDEREHLAQLVQLLDDMLDLAEGHLDEQGDPITTA